MFSRLVIMLEVYVKTKISLCTAVLIRRLPLLVYETAPAAFWPRKLSTPSIRLLGLVMWDLELQASTWKGQPPSFYFLSF